MQRTTEKPLVGVVYIPRKLGRKNPKSLKVDNFDFLKVLDGITHTADTVSNVANTVKNVSQTVSGTVEQVKTVVYPSPQQVYTAPVPVYQPAQASMPFSPVWVVVGMVVVIAIFMLIQKTK